MTEQSPKTLKMPTGVVVEPPPSMVDTAPIPASNPAALAENPAGALPANPPTLELGSSVGDLHGSKEPVTWAGASLELSNIGEHRPTSTLGHDPQGQTWLRWAVGGTAFVVLAVALVAMKGRHAEADPAPVEAAVEIPHAVEVETPTAPEPVPVEDPKAKKAKAKKSGGAAKRESTLAASSPASSDAGSKPSGASKPVTASKPSGASKPVTTSKPAAAPAPAAPSEPSKPNLAPPDDDAKGGSAALPDISAWDDQDAAVGDRSAAE